MSCVFIVITGGWLEADKDEVIMLCCNYASLMFFINKEYTRNNLSDLTEWYIALYNSSKWLKLNLTVIPNNTDSAGGVPTIKTSSLHKAGIIHMKMGFLPFKSHILFLSCSLI